MWRREARINKTPPGGKSAQCSAAASDHGCSVQLGWEKRPGRLGIGTRKSAGRLHTPHMRCSILHSVLCPLGLPCIESLKSRASRESGLREAFCSTLKGEF